MRKETLWYYRRNSNNARDATHTFLPTLERESIKHLTHGACSMRSIDYKDLRGWQHTTYHALLRKRAPATPSAHLGISNILMESSETWFKERHLFVRSSGGKESPTFIPEGWISRIFYII